MPHRIRLITLFLCLKAKQWVIPRFVRQLFLDVPHRLHIENPAKTDYHLLAKYENNQFFEVVKKNKQLKYACMSGNIPLIKHILNQGYTNLVMPFIYVCRKGSLESLKVLIELGANYYEDGIFAAVSYKNYDIIDFLFDKTDISDELISEICINGNLEIFKRIKCKKNKYFGDICNSGNIEFINYALNYKGIKYNDGLIGAVRSENLSIVKYIISLGAKNYKDAFEEAIFNYCYDIAKYLYINYGPMKIHHELKVKICESGVLEYIKYFLTKKQIIKYFEYICFSKNIEAVNYAISCGADNWTDGFHKAIIAENLDIIKLLYEKGAEIEDEDEDYDNLYYTDNIKLIEYLISIGVKKWKVFLYTSCRNKNHNLIEFIINKIEGDKDILNIGLKGAYASGDLNIVKRLIEAGANNIVNIFDNVCCDLNYELIEYLIKSGAKILAQLIYDVCRKNYYDIIKLIFSEYNAVCNYCGANHL